MEGVYSWEAAALAATSALRAAHQSGWTVMNLIWRVSGVRMEMGSGRVRGG